MTSTIATPDARIGNPDWVDNWTLGSGLRFELMETATQRVLICQTEVSANEVADFEPPEGFTQALVGRTCADLAFFSRSPGAEVDGPLETVEIQGRRFAYVARPAGFTALDSGAAEMTIDKHHTMLYRAGRLIDVLDFGDGTVATPAWSSASGVELTDDMLDDQWKLQPLRLTEDLITVVPHFARVIVLDKAFGFHGPVDAAVVYAASQGRPETASTNGDAERNSLWTSC